MVLQQALADLNTAYRNFFASVTGKRRAPRWHRQSSGPAKTVGKPSGSPLTPGSRSCRAVGCGCRSRGRQGPLVTRPAIAAVERTVAKDAAGRYFASFVVETDLAADAERFPPGKAEVGIDLGLTAFAVLSDGTVIKAPKFLRRAERKLKRLQRGLGRRETLNACGGTVSPGHTLAGPNETGTRRSAA